MGIRMSNYLGFAAATEDKKTEWCKSTRKMEKAAVMSLLLAKQWSVFFYRPDALLAPKQQCQSTESK